MNKLSATWVIEARQGYSKEWDVVGTAFSSSAADELAVRAFHQMLALSLADGCDVRADRVRVRLASK